MAIISVLTDKKSKVTKTILNKNLDKASAEHIVNGTGKEHDIRLEELPNLINNLTQNQCLCLGVTDNPEYEIDYKDPDKVSRTNQWFKWKEGPSFMLFDFDDAGLSVEEARDRLIQLDPALEKVGMVGIYSTSSYLFDTDDKKFLSEGQNFHLYIEVNYGELVPEYGKILADRCTLKGWSSINVIKNVGAKRIKTIFDDSVFKTPNREIFEANPVCCKGVESHRLDQSYVVQGEVLDIDESVENLKLTDEEYIRLRLDVKKMKDDPAIEEESKKQRKNRDKERTKRRAKVSGRSTRAEQSKTVNGQEWEDSSGVLHTFLGANDIILDEDGNDLSIKEIIEAGEEYHGKSLPDPSDPWKRGDEEQGIPGKGIAYVRWNEDESMHIFSHYGYVEYHLVWDYNSIIDYIHGETELDELDGFIDYLFDGQGHKHCLTNTQVDEIASELRNKNKILASKGNSKYGTDSRTIKSTLKKTLEKDEKPDEFNEEIPDHVIDINSRYGITLVGNKARIVTMEYKKEFHHWDTVVLDLRELKTLHEDRTVWKNKKPVGVFTDWNQSIHKNKFDRVVFEPRNDVFKDCGCRPIIKQGGNYNLWQGYLANLNNATSCDKILQHLHEVWCGGNDSMYNYILNWFAELFQNPASIGQPYIVLSSGQGAGKNILIDYVICPLLGIHAFTTHNKDDLIGNFNAHLQTNVFMFLDEAIFAGDPRTVAAMKSLINPQRVIEYKGLDKIYGHNYSKVIMASNNSYVANLEFDDRRHVYPDISRHRVGDRKYFNELAMEIENGGKEAFLKYMLEFTRNLDLCHIPEEGQSNQRFIDMRRSAEPPVKFALDLIFEGYELYEELLEEMQLLKAAKQWWDEGDTLYILKNDFVKLCNHYCDQSRVDRRWLDAQEIFVKLAKVNNMYATNQKSRERKNQCCLAVEQRLGKISIAIKDPERCREILGLTKKEE